MGQLLVSGDNQVPAESRNQIADDAGLHINLGLHARPRLLPQARLTHGHKLKLVLQNLRFFARRNDSCRSAGPRREQPSTTGWLDRAAIFAF